MSAFFTLLLFSFCIKSGFQNRIRPTDSVIDKLCGCLQIHTVSGFSVRHLIQDDMKKSFALFVVLALVFAVANLPTTEAFHVGGSWKRAVEV